MTSAVPVSSPKECSQYHRGHEQFVQDFSADLEPVARSPSAFKLETSLNCLRGHSGSVNKKKKKKEKKYSRFSSRAIEQRIYNADAREYRITLMCAAPCNDPSRFVIRDQEATRDNCPRASRSKAITSREGKSKECILQRKKILLRNICVEILIASV